MNKDFKYYVKYLVDVITVVLVYIATTIPTSVMETYSEYDDFVFRGELEYVLRCLFLFGWMIFTAIIIYKRRKK